MKVIKITQGCRAFIDDEDFEKVSRYRWYLVRPLKSKTLKYAACKKYPDGEKKTLLMHRLILNAPKGRPVDHIDRNGLNNQKSNLRICSIRENNLNCKIHKTNKSGYRGVCWHEQNSCYRAYFSLHNKTYHIGLFQTAKEAAIARNEKMKQLGCKFARLNPI